MPTIYPEHEDPYKPSDYTVPGIPAASDTAPPAMTVVDRESGDVTVTVEPQARTERLEGLLRRWWNLKLCEELMDDGFCWQCRKKTEEEPHEPGCIVDETLRYLEPDPSQTPAEKAQDES